MKEETIKLRALSTGYRQGDNVKIITAGIDASLFAGELTCLLGPNGAGKSTLLRTLTTTQPPVGGTFELLGREITGYTPAQLAREIGVVLTDRVTSDNLTVTDLVGLGRSPYTGFFGRLSADDRRIVGDAISLVGIDDLRDRSVSTLSDGERQKAMIARALAQETPVILLDEPTAFLDFPSKVEIMLLLRRLCREHGKTVFLSTHDLDLALMIADRLWLLDRSLGLTTGIPEDLTLDGSLPRYFSGEGITFDRATGLFGIEPRYSGEVTVSGSGERYLMTVKALARLGLRAIPPAPATPAEIDTAGEGTIEELINGKK